MLLGGDLLHVSILLKSLWLDLSGNLLRRSLSAAPSHAAPQEVALVVAEMLLCPANRNITYIK
jgi:hypothetical protein